MMMFYRRRASPKHRYDIIEVDYGGEGHRTRLKYPRDQLLCLWGAPSFVYKGGKEEGAGQGEEARPRGGNPTPSRFAPPFPNPRRRGKEGVGEGKGKGGAAPPLP